MEVDEKRYLYLAALKHDLNERSTNLIIGLKRTNTLLYRITIMFKTRQGVKTLSKDSIKSALNQTKDKDMALGE